MISEILEQTQKLPPAPEVHKPRDRASEMQGMTFADYLQEAMATVKKPPA